MQRGCNNVIASGDPQHDIEDGERHTESGTGGHVARPVQDVLVTFRASDLLLDPRVDRQRGEDDPGQHYRRYEHTERQLVPEDINLPWRHQPQRAVEEPDIPVWP